MHVAPLAGAKLDAVCARAKGAPEQGTLVLKGRWCSQKRPHCLWQSAELARAGHAALGFDSWEALWRNYTVFTAARNPFTRAASSYDYIYARHEVRGAFFVVAMASVLTRLIIYARHTALRPAAEQSTCWQRGLVALSS